MDAWMDETCVLPAKGRVAEIPTPATMKGLQTFRTCG